MGSVISSYALDSTVLLSTIAISIFLYRQSRSRRNGGEFAHIPLPPGPKGLPLIGNLLNMPSEKEWVTFAEWGNKYGEFS